MLSRKYKIDLKAINQNTESTSAISKASYEVENANNNGLSKRDVINQFNDLKKMKKFPSNLEYVDSYTDSLTGVTTSAFFK